MSATLLNTHLHKNYIPSYDIPLDTKEAEKFVSRLNPGLQFIQSYSNYHYFIGVCRTSLILPKSPEVLKDIKNVNGVSSKYGMPYSLGSSWRHSWGLTDYSDYVYDLPVLIHLILKNENGRFSIDTIKEQLFENKLLHLSISKKNHKIDYLEDPRIFVLNSNQLGVYCHYKLSSLETLKPKDITKMCELRIDTVKKQDCDSQETETYASHQKIAMSVIPLTNNKNLTNLRQQLAHLPVAIRNTPFEPLCNQFVGNYAEKNWAILQKPNTDYSIKFLSSIGYYGEPTLIQVYYNKTTSKHVFKPLCSQINKDTLTTAILKNNDLMIKTLAGLSTMNDPLDYLTTKFKRLFPNVLNGISVGGTMVALSPTEQLGMGHLKINYVACKDSKNSPALVQLGSLLKRLRKTYVLWGKDNELLANIDYLQQKNFIPSLHASLIYLTFFFKIDTETYQIKSVSSPFFFSTVGLPLSFLQFCHSITQTKHHYHIPYGNNDYQCNLLNVSKIQLRRFMDQTEINFKNEKDSYDKFFNEFYILENTPVTNKVTIYDKKEVLTKLKGDSAIDINIKKISYQTSSSAYTKTCAFTEEQNKNIANFFGLSPTQDFCKVFGMAACLKDWTFATTILGFGTTGMVFKICQNKQCAAVKIQRLENKTLEQDFQKSVALQKSLYPVAPKIHNHCVLTVQNTNFGIIIMDLVTGMTDKWLAKKRSLVELDSFIHQMGNLLTVMRKKKITHGDLGLFNIGYRTEEDKTTFLLTDFDRSSSTVFMPQVDFLRYIVEVHIATQSQVNQKTQTDNAKYLQQPMNLRKIGIDTCVDLEEILALSAQKTLVRWRELYFTYCKKAKVSCEL